MSGYSLNYSSDFETVREIKEKFCFVSADIEQDRKLANETCCFDKFYTLPDGSQIRLGRYFLNSGSDLKLVKSFSIPWLMDKI